MRTPASAIPVIVRVAPPRPAPSVLIQLRAEVLDEIKGVYREPAALFFSVLMPVAFFALFASMFGSEASEDGLPIATLMLATFGAYGALGSATMTPGIGLSEDRERGWLEVMKVSAVPIPLTLVAKVIATLPYTVGILAAMTGAAAALGALEISATEWLGLLLVLLIGALPFSLVGLAVGALASGNATTAILNAIVIPLAIAGGLWFPLESLPSVVGDIAPALPTYHLAQLALVPLLGGDWIGHVVYLLGFAALAGMAAVVAYRRSPT